jgi:glycerophosphoryl diester phosphodiesterase
MKVPDRFLCVAHRGAAGDGLAPENTLAAFEMAIALGTDAIECDVHGTADRAVVVMHDAKVDRTTNGKGAIAEMTHDAIKRLDAGAWKGAPFAGEQVPTLREMLKRIAGRALSIIEVKAPGIARAVVEDVVAAGSVESAVIFSFDETAVREAREADSRIATALLIGGKPIESSEQLQDLVKRTADLGAGAIAPGAGAVTPDLVRAFHAAGLKVWVWTVNEPEQMRRFRALGVDAIITDRIDLLNEVMKL